MFSLNTNFGHVFFILKIKMLYESFVIDSSGYIEILIVSLILGMYLYYMLYQLQQKLKKSFAVNCSLVRITNHFKVLIVLIIVFEQIQILMMTDEIIMNMYLQVGTRVKNNCRYCFFLNTIEYTYLYFLFFYRYQEFNTILFIKLMYALSQVICSSINYHELMQVNVA